LSQGHHIILDIHECTKNLIYTPNTLDRLSHLILLGELTLVGISSKIFDENYSYSSAFLLAESHVAVHTWPEYKYVSADVFVCNYSKDNTKAAEKLAQSIIDFYGSHVSSSIITRVRRG
jgi:S-adenosylmethionine decarboxylase